jgi:hypothetical protein
MVDGISPEKLFKIRLISLRTEDELAERIGIGPDNRFMERSIFSIDGLLKMDAGAAPERLLFQRERVRRLGNEEPRYGGISPSRELLPSATTSSPEQDERLAGILPPRALWLRSR